MEEISDAVLIARAKENPEEFGLLYERYVGRIYNYIYYRTGNHHDAEDLTARTFMQALKHIRRYVDYGAPFSAYLHRIAHNMVVNWHRDQQRRRIVSLDQLAGMESDVGAPDATLEEEHEQQVLLHAVRRLSPDRQHLLALKHAEGLSIAEIAAIMGRSEGAVKSLYHRTLVTLRDELERVQAGNGGRTGEARDAPVEKRKTDG